MKEEKAHPFDHKTWRYMKFHCMQRFYCFFKNIKYFLIKNRILILSEKNIITIAIKQIKGN